MPRSQSGSKEQQILAYFRDTELAIAVLVFGLVSGIVKERKAKSEGARNIQLKLRKAAESRAAKVLPPLPKLPRKKKKKAKVAPTVNTSTTPVPPPADSAVKAAGY